MSDRDVRGLKKAAARTLPTVQVEVLDQGDPTRLAYWNYAGIRVGSAELYADGHFDLHCDLMFHKDGYRQAIESDLEKRAQSGAVTTYGGDEEEETVVVKKEEEEDIYVTEEGEDTRTTRKRTNFREEQEDDPPHTQEEQERTGALKRIAHSVMLDPKGRVVELEGKDHLAWAKENFPQLEDPLKGLLDSGWIKVVGGYGFTVHTIPAPLAGRLEKIVRLMAKEQPGQDITIETPNGDTTVVVDPTGEPDECSLQNSLSGLLSLVVKGTLKKEAYGGESWVSPDGEWFDAGGNHLEWAEDNYARFGIDFHPVDDAATVEDVQEDAEGYYAWDKFLHEGWVRVKPPDGVEAMTDDVDPLKGIVRKLARDYRPERVFFEGDEPTVEVLMSGRPDFTEFDAHFARYAQKGEGPEKIKLVLIQGGTRHDGSCPGENSKTSELLAKAMQALPDDVEVTLLDLAVRADGEKRVQPCQGCISTAGGYHCHWPCSCYQANDPDPKRKDVLHDEDIYNKLREADGFAVFTPVHWYGPTTQVKAMFDRLVCASATLPAEQAMGEWDLGKDPEKTRAASAEKRHDSELRNWLDGKVAAFFAHGDNGADDMKRVPPSAAYNKEFDEGIVNDPKEAIMPLVAQCKYSGIHVPDDCIVGYHVNKGLSYADANDNLHKGGLPTFERKAVKLLQRLVDHCRGAEIPVGEGMAIIVTPEDAARAEIAAGREGQKLSTHLMDFDVLFDDYRAAETEFQVADFQVFKHKDLADPPGHNLPPDQMVWAYTDGGVIHIDADLTRPQFEEAIKHELDHIAEGDLPTFEEEYPELAKETRVAYKLVQGKFNDAKIQEFMDAREGTILGAVRDFITNPKVLELLGNAMYLPVMVLNRPIQKGQEVDPGEWTFFGVLGSYKGQPTIFASNKHGADEVMPTILEEAAHYLRESKGREMQKQDITTMTEEEYANLPEEISAKGFVDYIMTSDFDAQEARQEVSSGRDGHRVHADLHEYASTHVLLPPDLASSVLGWARTNIAEEDIYEDPEDPTLGMEDNPHVTVLYGILSEDPFPVQQAIGELKSPKVELRKTDIFEGEDKPYDVVKINVRSQGLHKIRKALAEGVENEQTYPDYRPHVTLAYVKKGAGKKYVGLEDFEGQSFYPDAVEFTDKDENPTAIQLLGGEERQAQYYAGDTWNYDMPSEVKRTEPVQMPSSEMPAPIQGIPAQTEPGFEEYRQFSALMVQNRRFIIAEGFTVPRFFEIFVNAVDHQQVDPRRIDADITINWSDEMYLDARMFGTMLEEGRIPETYVVLPMPGGDEKTFRLDADGIKSLAAVLDTRARFGHPYNVGGAPLARDTGTGEPRSWSVPPSPSMSSPVKT